MSNVPSNSFNAFTNPWKLITNITFEESYGKLQLTVVRRPPKAAIRVTGV